MFRSPSAGKRVRFHLPRVEIQVILRRVVVKNINVPVGKEALGDEEVMGLVTREGLRGEGRARRQENIDRERNPDKEPERFLRF